MQLPVWCRAVSAAMSRHRKTTFVGLLVAVATVGCVFHFSSVKYDILSSLQVPSRRQNPAFAANTEESVNVNDKNERQLETFQNRRDHTRRECQARKDIYYRYQPHMVPGQFLFDSEHLFLMCYIPKNGCSFWKRVFSIIDGKNEGKSVFNLSGTAIHTKQTYGTLQNEKRSLIGMYHTIRTSKKALFVRDPYARLFSGYIDKLFSPCSFSSQQAIIRKHFRRPPLKEECPRPINFTEFLLYVTNKQSVKVDSHFRQQYTSCSPCHVDYDFIGKLETFSQDSNFILRESLHLDPSAVFGAEEDFEQNSDVNIMEDITLRTWTGCRKGSCLSVYNRMRRLWLVFQIRGFLSIKQKFPLSRKAANKTTMKRFLDIVLLAYKQSKDRTAVKLQRQQALVEAFRSVPLDVLIKVEKYVFNDCRLFGYNCSLNSRFHVDSPAPRPLFNMHEALLAD